MSEKLHKLFSEVKQYGKYTRSNKLDGLTQWNKLKGIFQESRNKVKWNPDVKRIFVEMRSDLKLQECMDEVKDKDIWEKHHFYLQHARVPTLNYNDASLNRLMQIAYNAGQFEAMRDDEFYDDEKKRYYANNKLGNIETYMDKDSLETLNVEISDDMREKLDVVLKDSQLKGGDIYKNKYFKYKNKYLRLEK